MTPLREIAQSIFRQALADCSVENAVAKHVTVKDGLLQLGEESISLLGLRRIRVIAAGKAAGAMLTALLRHFPPGISPDLAGIVIAPEAPPQLPDSFHYFAGGHPMPNEMSFAGARAALDLLQTIAKDADEQPTLCLFLISGGASAMMELPFDPAITLEETAAFHRALVASGAPITEMNCVRKHFSAVKGGRLALAAGRSLCQSLLISDVPADRLDTLGSGPTIPDSSTVAECRKILEHYRLLPQFSASVRRFFESAALPETPKPADLRASAAVLLSADDLAQAAARCAQALGFYAVIDNSCDEWEYRAAAKYLLDRLRALRGQHSRVCLISAGEVSVSLPSGTSGRGGRNQQFALYAATLLTPADNAVAILSAGSDGIDGNSPAAGAVVDRSILSERHRHDAQRALENFDTYPFLTERNATITIGPSGNNLRDLRIFLARSRADKNGLPHPQRFHKPYISI